MKKIKDPATLKPGTLVVDVVGGNITVARPQRRTWNSPPNTYYVVKGHPPTHPGAAPIVTIVSVSGEGEIDWGYEPDDTSPNSLRGDLRIVKEPEDEL